MKRGPREADSLVDTKNETRETGTSAVGEDTYSRGKQEPWTRLGKNRVEMPKIGGLQQRRLLHLVKAADSGKQRGQLKRDSMHRQDNHTRSLSVDNFFEFFFKEDHPNNTSTHSVRTYKDKRSHKKTRSHFDKPTATSLNHVRVHSKVAETSHGLIPAREHGESSSKKGISNIQIGKLADSSIDHGNTSRSKGSKQEFTVSKEKAAEINRSRRFCIVDNFMVNSSRAVPKSIESLLQKFKSSILRCETDIKLNLGIDTIKVEMFNDVPFLSSGKFDRFGYLNVVQSSIEGLINALRGGHFFKQPARRSPNNVLDSLRQDLVISLIRQVFNLESILVLLILYFRLLLSFSLIEKAEAVGKIALSISFILEMPDYQTEVYTMLGMYYDKIKDCEASLFCFTRAMQITWETGDKAKELFLCDKIGIQLYNMNELILARLYHERMITGFCEPPKSNAMIRSKDIMQYERKLFAENFLCRPGVILDKYRSVRMLTHLETTPLDSHLEVQRDENDNPVILSFIESVLYAQKITMELEVNKNSVTTKRSDALIEQRSRLHNFAKGDDRDQGKIRYTQEGQRVLKDDVEFIQKVGLLGHNMKADMRVSHQRNVNAIFNYLNYTHNEGTKVDFEYKKTKGVELARKNAIEDLLIFLARSRYFVIKKYSEGSLSSHRRKEGLLRGQGDKKSGLNSSRLTQKS